MEIRSYNAVFALERRIYRVDRVRLNPSGVPVRGVVYFVALMLFGLVLAGLPVLGAVLRLVPWYMRAIALPGGLAALLAILRVDGRAFHLAAAAVLRDARLPRALHGAGRPVTTPRRWRPNPLLCLPDGSDARMRRMRYSGPGTIVVSSAHVRGLRGPRSRAEIVVEALPGRTLARPRRIVLADRGRLAVR